MAELHRVKLKSNFINIDGAKIHYLSGGEEKNSTVLILHGWASRAAIFKHLSQHLAIDHFVLIPDLPGCGQSSTLKKANFQEFAKTILALLEKLNINSVSIVAHSMGGGIGVEMAILDPKKIKSLLLLSSALDPIDRSLWDWFVVNYQNSRKVLNPKRFWQLVTVSLVFCENFIKHPIWTYTTFYLSTRSDLLSDLKKIKVSPMVICADDEDEFLPAINKVCQILSIQPTVIKGPGHNWPILEPHQAADIIEQYV